MPDLLNPPPLIQNPNEPVVTISAPKKSQNFDLEKVLAAVGVILVAMTIIIAGMVITLNNLQDRVKVLEEDLNNSTKVSVATHSAKLATPSASATSSAR
jgi:hypothetical protein